MSCWMSLSKVCFHRHLVSAELVLFSWLLKKLATVKSGCAVSSWPFAKLSQHFQMQWPNPFSCLGKQWFCCGRQQSHHFFSAMYVFFSLQTTFMLWRPPTLFYASLWKENSFQVFKAPFIWLNSLGPQSKASIRHYFRRQSQQKYLFCPVPSLGLNPTATAYTSVLKPYSICDAYRMHSSCKWKCWFEGWKFYTVSSL